MFKAILNLSIPLAALVITGCQPDESPKRLSLRDALAKGDVQIASASSNRMDSVSLTLESARKEGPYPALEVEITAGTVFRPTVPGQSNGSRIILASATARFRQGTTVTLKAASFEMKEEPKLVLLQPTEEAAPKDLSALIASKEFAAAEFRLQQYAIWTITARPAHKSSFLAIVIPDPYSNAHLFPQGPSDDVLKRVMELLDASGIDSSNYAVLKEFQRKK